MDSIPEKQCTKCGEKKPATDQYFYTEWNHNKTKRKLTASCKGCLKKSSNKRYHDNPEKTKEYGKTYYQNNREKKDRQSRDWAINNPQGKKAIEKRYREKHPVTCRQSNKKWLDNNPLKKREYTGRRRNRKANAEGKYTAADIQLLHRSQKGRCWYCQKVLDGKYEIEHRVPISRGGTNWPNNLCLVCRKCNRSKSDKLPHEWNGRLL